MRERDLRGGVHERVVLERVRERGRSQEKELWEGEGMRDRGRERKEGKESMNSVLHWEQLALVHFIIKGKSFAACKLHFLVFVCVCVCTCSIYSLCMCT